MMKLMAAIGVAAALAGCSGGFAREEMQRGLLEERERFFTDDEDVLKIEQLRPQIRFPIRLAVLPPARQGPFGGDGALMEGEREEIVSWGEKLKKEGIVSDFMIIPDMLLATGAERGRSTTLKSVRIAAARMQADAVLILRSVTDTDSYINPLGVLDLTIVGMFLVPGHQRDALTMVEGMVIDNRNQFLYFAASAEGKGSAVSPLALLDKRDAVGESRKNALRAFGENLVTEARRAQAYVPGPRYDSPGQK